MRRRLGDRRTKARYDIVGELWGTLERVVSMPLHNIGRTGALIQSSEPLPGDSVHRVVLTRDGQDSQAQVRVRHVQEALTPDGERTYLIGLEFMSVQPALAEQIERWLDAREQRSGEA